MSNKTDEEEDIIIYLQEKHTLCYQLAWKCPNLASEHHYFLQPQKKKISKQKQHNVCSLHSKPRYKLTPRKNFVYQAVKKIPGK